ncbi:ER membrane protein complex subunit 1-like [Corticium candelabrum]|uniref:ER membrane protein complex subunit 1-like n=1 Tax=Corticium candelabrum TaxID=121492 RepID=UPI002E263154|nr:ER membrane protein complex subunit 1-like [Corticium candelabrum]
MLLFLQLLLHLGCVVGLYEDQVGNFDWHQKYLGSVKAVYFDQSSHTTKRIIMSTYSNVLASINARTGQILWRRVLEQNGIIDAVLHQNGVLITVSRRGSLIRSWDPATGLLLWESATPGSQLNFRDSVSWLNGGVQADLMQHSEGKGYIIAVLRGNLLTTWLQNGGRQLWNVTISKELKSSDFLMSQDGDILHVVSFREKAHVIFHSYQLKSGEEIKPSHTVSTPWLSFESSSCLITGGHMLLCVDKVTEAAHWLSMKTTDKQSFEMVFLQSIDSSMIGLSPMAVSHLSPITSTHQDFLLHLSTDKKVLMAFDAVEAMPVARKVFENKEDIRMGTLGDMRILFILSQQEEGSLDIQCLTADDLIEMSELAQTVEMPDHLGALKQAFVYLFHKKDKSLGYRMLLATKDQAVSLIQQNGRLLWTREESLSDICAVEVLDLPIATGKSHLENLFIELATATGDPISLFMQRITVQLTQLQTFLSSLNGKQEDELEDLTVEGMSRDRFNLQKLIVVLTAAGKLFGIDSRDGQIHWRLYLSDLKPFSGLSHKTDNETCYMFVQRTSEHFPHPPQVTVVGSSKGECRGSLVYVINPLTGHLVKSIISNSSPCLPYTVTQAALLPVEDNNLMRVLLLTDRELKVHLFPPSTAALEAVVSREEAVFIHIVNCSSGSVTGYSVDNFEFEGTTAKLEEVWNVKVQPDETIISYAARPAHEHVHAQALVLGDRSVLYKYLNPNLIAIATETATEKGGIGIYILDSVTGSIIYQFRHRSAHRPVHIIHSENWFLYHLWNPRQRRYEVSVLDLYEGSLDRNDSHVSSMDPLVQPNILSQSYIFSSAIMAMGVTITEKGITHKTVMFGLSNGAILSLPKMLLDARRTVSMMPEQSEEFMIPYQPELPLRAVDVVNYNQTVINVKGLHTVSAGLESTCLLFAYGLDLYSTRVMPSKTFDVLAEDFDRFIIVIVLLLLGLLTVITARLANRKLLHSQWK